METKFILIVDDNITLLESMCRLFRDEGFLLKVATDAEEAMEVVRVEDVDLIIMDVDIPIMNGIDVLIEIKEIRPRIPVLIMTGEESKEIKIRALEAGASTFFIKPIDINILRRQIYKFLGI